MARGLYIVTKIVSVACRLSVYGTSLALLFPAPLFHLQDLFTFPSSSKAERMQMQSDTFESFLSRVFKAPDLLHIDDFNTNIHEFMESHVSASLNFQPSSFASKKQQQEKYTVPVAAQMHYVPTPIQQMLPPSMKEKSRYYRKLSDMGCESNNIVDELDDARDRYITLYVPSPEEVTEALVRRHQQNVISGKTGAYGSVMPTLFDCSNTLDRIDKAHAINGMALSNPAVVDEVRKAVESKHGSKKNQHRSRKHQGQSLGRSLAGGLLLRHVDIHYTTGSPDSVHAVTFTDAAESAFMAAGVTSYTCVKSLMGQPGSAPQHIIHDHERSISFVVVSDDFSLIATCGEDKNLCLYETVNFQRTAVMNHPAAVTCADFAPNGLYLVSGSVDCKCRLWSSKLSDPPTRIVTYGGHRDRITAIAFSVVGGQVASGSMAGEVHLWAANSGELITVFAEHTLQGAIINLSFNWNGEILLAADKDRMLLSEVRSGVPLRMMVAGTHEHPPANKNLFEGSKMFFTFATFAPKYSFPNYFLVGKSDGTVLLYEFSVEKVESRGQRSMARAVTVTIQPEIWSTKLKVPTSCAVAGPYKTMLLGDINGNVVSLTLEPSTKYVEPRQSIGAGKQVYIFPRMPVESPYVQEAMEPM